MTIPSHRHAASALCVIASLLIPRGSPAVTGHDAIFSRSFFDRCVVDSVRARLGADGSSVKYSIEGSCPGGRISGQLAYRSGGFNEAFDLGGPGVLKSKGTCSDNPWAKAARCGDVLVQGDGPGIASLLAQQPYSPTGEITAPFSLMVPGAASAFRTAHDNADRPRPPVAPAGVKVSEALGSATVQLSWLAPDESGDRPYLHFLAQARPRDMEGAAWIELGKFDRKGVSAYSASVRLPPPIAGTAGWDVRLCSATALAITCGAPQAPASVAGNGIGTVAPDLSAAAPTVADKVGRAPSPRVHVSPSACERAADARARNSPAAAALAAKCRAEGGESAGASTPDLDVLADEGATRAAADPLATRLRESLADGDARRGFDVAMAVAHDQTEWGPGKQKILEALSASGQSGFKTATSYLFDRNRYAERARLGASIVATRETLRAASSMEDDARFELGFDIATAIFGDPALGAQGNTTAGPGSLGIRNSLSAPAQRGFDAAMQLHLLERR